MNVLSMYGLVFTEFRGRKRPLMKRLNHHSVLVGGGVFN